MRIHTLRGNMQEGLTRRLVVDDGRLNHGMRVTKFVVFTDDPSNISHDVHAVLGYQGNFVKLLDASDNNQIAWASSNVFGVGGIDYGWSLIDPNHVIIRDLYITGTVGTSGGAQRFNYYIEMEAVDLSDDQTILQLIKERNQGELR